MIKSRERGFHRRLVGRALYTRIDRFRDTCVDDIERELSEVATLYALGPRSTHLSN
jgi:hypothetical protein